MEHKRPVQSSERAKEREGTRIEIIMMTMMMEVNPTDHHMYNLDKNFISTTPRHLFFQNRKLDSSKVVEETEVGQSTRHVPVATQCHLFYHRAVP